MPWNIRFPSQMRSRRMKRGVSPLNREFDHLVHSLLEEWHVPGMSIALVDGPHTFSKGYGIAVYPDTKATPETLYYTASTTKSFTAAATSLIIDDNKKSPTKEYGQIHWKTTLSSILREDFVLPDTHVTAHVTIEDALSHRTGMPDHSKRFAPFYGTSVRDSVRLLRHLPLATELRTKFMYNNTMFMTVSHMIETVTGTNLGLFLRERIWTPLDMLNTYWGLDDARSSEAVLARGYAWDSSAHQYVPEKQYDLSNVSGAGAIISSVVDYAKWIRCMMTRSAPLSREAHDALVEPRTINAQDPGGRLIPLPQLYALGWIIASYRGKRVVMHGGGVLGYGSLMVYLPERQWGVVMAANTTGTSNYVLMILYMHLLDRLLGTPEEERLDWGEMIKDNMNQSRERQAHAREILYPNVPHPPLPPALDIKGYAGEYWHPAYRTIQFTFDPDSRCLIADRTAVPPTMIAMEHISGEFWLATLQMKNQDARDYERFRAEFKIGSDGRVQEVGLDLEPEMKGQKIWFQRV